MASAHRTNDISSHATLFCGAKVEEHEEVVVATNRVYAPDSDPAYKEEIRDAVQSASEAMSSGLLDWTDSDSSQKAGSSTSIHHHTDLPSSQNGGNMTDFSTSEILSISDEAPGPSAPILPVPNTWHPISVFTQAYPPSRQGSRRIRSASSSRLSSSSISTQFSDENSNIFETQARLFERAVKAHDKLRKQNSMQRRQIDALRKRIKVLERSVKVQQQQNEHRHDQSASQ